MAENIQKVKIATTEKSLRATSLRASITTLLAIDKCGNPREIRNAKVAFDLAIAGFKRTFGEWMPEIEEEA